MAVSKQEDLVALKRAISSMRPKIDRLLSGGEKRELLKLISRGLVSSVNDLRAYLNRVEQMKARRHKEQTCKLMGKVIDADSRRPLSRAQVKIQHTTFDEETDATGNFIWENMVKGRQYVIDAFRRGYRKVQYQYKAEHDDEQIICIKMAPVRRGGPANPNDPRSKRGPRHGH